MKIRMLGTGYGECKIKNAAAKDFRGKGGVLIDDTLLIDAPSDIHTTARELGFDNMFKGVYDVLITHSHRGHFSKDAIDELAKKKRVRVYASPDVLSLLGDNQNLTKYEISPFRQFSIGKYSIVPLPTNHSTDILGEECFNFLIYSDKAILYALDGGWINPRAWNLLTSSALDAVICDTAEEAKPTSAASVYHNDIHTVARIKQIFLDSGIAGEKTKFVLSHIPSDKKRSIHEELSPIAKQYGMILSYDGYFFTV